MEGNIVDIQMDRPLHSYTLLLSANCWLKANKQGKAKRIKQKKTSYIWYWRYLLVKFQQIVQENWALLHNNCHNEPDYNT